MTRISENLRYESTNNRINMVKSNTDNAQEIAISGRKLKNLSDDPAGAIRVFKNRTRLQNIDQYRKGIDFSRGFLERTEQSLSSINESLIRARELAVQQSNSTWSETDRLAVSQELKQIISHVISLGNSTYGDKYVFGGFKTLEPPISSDGKYTGDDGKIFIQLDEDNFKTINMSGREIFDTNLEEEGKFLPIIETLQTLYNGLSQNNINDVRNSITYIDKNITKVINALATMGAKSQAINDIEERIDKKQESFYKDNNNIEAADPIKSALDLKSAENSLQYTLQASAKMLSPSLLNFLQ